MDGVRIINIPKIEDSRGNLSFVENGSQLPFDIARSYWIYDVPGGSRRGGHAFRRNDEVIIALSGALDVVVDNGQERQVFSLTRSFYGLYVPHGIWREMRNFTTNSVALILSSIEYDESDYIFDYELFKSHMQ
jgi:dTDP-4-dehydrorhamnose 3,5-epimerase-like enzyme